MKEREGNSNQPELTQKPIQATFKAGDIFMAEPGQGEQPKAEKLADLSVLPDKTKIAARRYLAERGKRKLTFDENQTLRLMLGNPELASLRGASEDSEFTIVKADGITAFKLENKTLSAKDAKEFIKIFQGKHLDASEKELKDKLYKALGNDPEGFADIFAKAVDSLSDEDLKDILDKGTEALLVNFINEVNKRTKGKLSPALLDKYKREATELKTLSPQEAKVELKALLDRVEEKHRDLAGEDAFKELSKEEEEKIYTAIVEVEAKMGLPKELSLSEETLKKYTQRLMGLSSLSKEERIKEARAIFKELDEEKVRKFGDKYKGKPAEPDQKESESEPEIPHSFVDEDRGELEVLIENLSVLSESADDPSNMNMLKGNIHIRGHIGEIYSTNEGALKAALIEIEQIDKIEDYNQWKAKYKAFVSSLKASARTATSLFSGIRRSANEDFDGYGVPNSIEAVAKWISENVDSEIWGPNGAHPIIENDKFNQANFLLWVRDWSVKLHVGNPNSEMSPLTAISLKIGISEIQLYNMVFHNRERFMKSKTTGRVLNDLADQAYLESWFFGVLRNTSLAYTQIMTSDTELPKALTQFHAKSDLTRGNTLKQMLSAPAEFGKEGDTIVGDGIRMANDLYYHWSDEGKLKEILGIKNDPNISDEEKQKKEFSVDDFKNAMRILQKKKEWDKEDWDNVGTYQGFHAEDNNIYYEIGQSKKKYMFDKKGNLDWANFISVMNFYKENTAEQFTISMARELVREKLSQKYGSLSDGIAHSQKDIDNLKRERESLRVAEFERLTKLGKLNKGEAEQNAEQHADHILMTRRHAKRINLEYAEHSSFEMQRGYGIAARNDTNRRGFDAATKLFLSDYLIRQSGENTAGPIGIPGEIPIFKMLGPDMWVGLKTESGLSPYSIYEAIRKIENSSSESLKTRYLEEGRLNQTELNKLSDEQKKEAVEHVRQKEKTEWIDKLSFRAKAENEYAGNQNTNAFDIFHSVTDSQHLDLNEIVSFSLLEGIKYNPQKFEAMIKDGFIKPMRYAFASNNGLNYGQKVRVFDYHETNRINDKRKKKDLEPIAPIYKDALLAQAMFGDRAFEGIKIAVGESERKREVSLLDAMNSTNDEEKKAASKYLSGDEVRRKMVKNLARTRIAAQLGFHRQFGGIGPRWDYDRAETFIKALQSMKAYEIDPEDPNKVQQTGASYFSKEDIAWIRRHSNTRLSRLVGEAVATQGGLALVGATPKMLGTLLQYVIKQ